jgi:hypothetical protein
MTAQPPSGSKIILARDGQDELITIPPPAKTTAQFGIAAFLSCWIVGWAVGWVSAFGALFGKAGPGAGGGKAFLAFWLCGWTVGGIFAIRTLRALLRKPTPALFRLRSDGIAYDSGTAPVQWSTDPKFQKNFWGDVFKKRLIRQFTSQELTSLKLREADGSNRLTIDAGNERIDLAVTATEVEREWLFECIARRYNLATVANAGGAERKPPARAEGTTPDFVPWE